MEIIIAIIIMIMTDMIKHVGLEIDHHFDVYRAIIIKMIKVYTDI